MIAGLQSRTNVAAGSIAPQVRLATSPSRSVPSAPTNRRSLQRWVPAVTPSCLGDRRTIDAKRNFCSLRRASFCSMAARVGRVPVYSRRSASQVPRRVPARALGRSSAAAGMAAEGREPLAIRGQDDRGPRVLRRCCPAGTNFLCGEITGLNRSTIAYGSFNHPVLIRGRALADLEIHRNFPV
jgi:hypothetical protein